MIDERPVALNVLPVTPVPEKTPPDGVAVRVTLGFELLQTGLFPKLKVTAVVLTVSFRTEAADVPQPLMALTDMTPPVLPGVVMIAGVTDVPVHPFGRVHI